MEKDKSDNDLFKKGLELVKKISILIINFG